MLRLVLIPGRRTVVAASPVTSRGIGEQHGDPGSEEWVLIAQREVAALGYRIGYVDRIDYKFPVGANDRYGLDIAFAKSGALIDVMCYSIEPMVPEPAADFYKQFIKVTKGQKVKKGDTIAYMYLPPGAGIGCHIHFHMQQKNQNNFLAPAIFSGAVVDSFSARWGTFGNDGATAIPSCMGYMLDADENPFGTGAVDLLK